MKTGILVHGCNVNAENWRHIAWGNSPGEMGRIPQGLLAALEFNAEVIVFGTGASRKQYNFGDSEKTGQILLEAEYSLAFLESHFDDLMRFKAFADACDCQSEADWQKLQRWLMERIELDLQSTNTVSELREAGERFLRHRCERVVVVSSPTHLIRVLRDASVLYQQDRRFELFQDRLLAMPCTTCYEGSTAADVVVVEPPHRPDRHVVPTHRRIARMMDLQKLGHEPLIEFLSELDELMQRYEDIQQNGPPITPTAVWPQSNVMPTLPVT